MTWRNDKTPYFATINSGEEVLGMKNRTDYETSCYIDGHNTLAGILHVNDICYIDFDRKDIFVKGKCKKISPKNMLLLETLILRSPSIVNYETLFMVYYGENYYTVDKTDMQVLRNFKTAIDKFITIDKKSKLGYGISLNKKIKKFPNVYKEDVSDINELFPEKNEKNPCTNLPENAYELKEKALKLSEKFFHSGAKALIEASGEVMIKKLEELSKIFNNIAVIDNLNTNGNIIHNAYEIILKGCRDSSINDILKIKGPLGSYKNRIMQYLFLSVAKNNDDILPFYIDIAFYERIAEHDHKISENDIISAFNSDVEDIETLLKEYNKKPVLFLDGVRDFSRGNESLYYCIRKKIEALKCKLVVCLDADFTINKQHQFNVHPLGSDIFSHCMDIGSMNLQKRAKSIEFIDNCINISNIQFPTEISAEKIYECLVRLNFSNIDSYWLVYILKTVPKHFLDAKCNIADLYNAICIDILGNSGRVDSAAELAYEFEFGTVDSDNTNLFYDVRWRLIRKHRSVLDFLIAKQYVKKVSELNLIKGNDEHNSESLAFFNMVLQKNITRFVIAMLKGVDDYEHQIMKIAKYHYDLLSLFGKSELTFWMARLQNPKRKKECVELLKSYHDIEIARCNSAEANDPSEKRDIAFLLRGINVSLIYENDRDALEFYLNSLLKDKTANSVNRGFHLEYYGDKPYIPNKTLLDFEDDITKGEKTLTVLCLSLDSRINNKDTSSYVAILEVMTICNLIQARIEQSDKENVLNVKTYISKCLRYLDWIIPQRSLRDLPEVVTYFEWIRDEFTVMSNNDDETVSYSHASPYNKFSHAKKVERTGWIKHKVPHPENIVEHMYNCWLIGALYLPNEYDDDTYNKNHILQMLLIHDLAETETGDVNRPEKLKKQAEYDEKENMVMQSLLLTGTYPGAIDLTDYVNCWNDWDNKNDLNYFIAKDIDNIQTIYQFCDYYNQHQEIFTDDDIVYWLSGLDTLETELGKDISEKLILRNPVFSHIVAGTNDITEHD